MGRLRLGYTKSRNGCLRCKQRRVKCDENQPCQACVRHGIECSLVTGSRSSSETPTVRRSRTASPQTSQPSSVRSSSRSLQPLTTTAPTPHAYTSTPPPSATTPDAYPSDPYPNLPKFISPASPFSSPSAFTTEWLSDLKLLHHFTTSTAASIFRPSPSSVSRHFSLWSIDVPRIAFDHVFLLHQVLATAAFHLAYLHPQERNRYHVLAVQHQTMSIAGVRHAVQNLTRDNCHAIFAASSLVFITAFAAAGPTSIPPPPLKTPLNGLPPNPKGVTVDELVDVFLLVKGIGGVLDTAETELKSGPFSKLFFPDQPAEEGESLTLTRVTAQLQVFLSRVAELPESDEVRTLVEAEVKKFVECIRRAAAMTWDPEYRVIGSYPIVMGEGFVSLLRRRNPVALALLSYYCVVVHATECGVWFTRGWGLGIMRDVVGEMRAPWDEDSAWALGWMRGHEGG